MLVCELQPGDPYVFLKARTDICVGQEFDLLIACKRTASGSNGANGASGRW